MLRQIIKNSHSLDCAFGQLKECKWIMVRTILCQIFLFNLNLLGSKLLIFVFLKS